MAGNQGRVRKVGRWNPWSCLTTRNSFGRLATGRDVITRSASGLDLASDPAGELSTMPPVPNESFCSYRRSGNSTRRKWSHEMNKEVMFCYYHVFLSSGVSAFRKPVHRLWCQGNPSLADVSEQRLADQKRYLLASGKLTESELEEIKREAAQDGIPGSGLSSAMAADHSSVQTLIGNG